MSVFIIQYMQTRAYVKRILRFSYWCKKRRNIISRWRISFKKVQSESIDETFERSHVFLLTIFIVSVMPNWILIFFWQAWTSNNQILYWIAKYIGINAIFATRIPCLLSTLLRNGDTWIYKINSIWLKFPGLCKIQMQICNSCYCSLNLY